MLKTDEEREQGELCGKCKDQGSSLPLAQFTYPGASSSMSM